jgi:hypothetical protein
MVASFLGKEGTLIGAVVGSVVAGVSVPVYSHFIKRAAKPVSTLSSKEINLPLHKLPSIALMTGVTLLIGIAGITSAEAALGKPVSAAITGKKSTGTTLSQVVAPQAYVPASTPIITPIPIISSSSIPTVSPTTSPSPSSSAASEPRRKSPIEINNT